MATDEQMIAAAVARLEIGCQPVMVHSSLKAVCAVTGCAPAVARAFWIPDEPCWCWSERAVGGF